MHRSIALLLLFIGALVLRFVFFGCFLKDNPCKLMYDAGHYHEIAQSVTAGNGFTLPNGTPQFYRVPGYSLFLALGYKVFKGDVNRTLLLQLVVASLIPVFIFLLTCLIFPRDRIVSWGAGILAAVHPGLLIFSGLVMSESLFLLVFLLFLLLFFNQLKSPKISKRYSFLAGLTLGFLALIRPVGLPLLLVSAGVILVTAWDREAMGNGFKKILLLGFGWVLGAGGWLLRNLLLTGFVFFHTLPGVHFLNHMASRLVMYEENISYEKAKKKLVKELDERVASAAMRFKRPINDIEYSNIAEALSMEVVNKYPVRALILSVVNMLKTTLSLYSSELLVIEKNGMLPTYRSDTGILASVKKFLFPRIRNNAVYAFIYYEIFLLIFMLVGNFIFFMQVFLKQDYLLFIQLFSFIVLFIFLSLACGFARLRLPIEPFLIIVTSMFWVSFFQGKRFKSE